MASKAEELLADLTAVHVVMDPQHEGLRDYAKLNLNTVTMTEIQHALADYDRRAALMHTAQVACEALRDDGYPVLPVREVPSAALADLQVNADTIHAALGQFASSEAVGMTLKSGAKEPKRG